VTVLYCFPALQATKKHAGSRFIRNCWMWWLAASKWTLWRLSDVGEFKSLPFSFQAVFNSTSLLNRILGPEYSTIFCWKPAFPMGPQWFRPTVSI